MWGRGRIGVILVAVLVVAALGAALAWRPAIAAIEPPGPGSIDTALARRGESLAAVGNCIACHTVPGGRSFAGGLAVPTPFGTIYSTNITPDPETGIGRWSEAAFARAMREGVDREGHHLYPAFPYDHFTRVTDEDMRALYAFLQSRQPVRAAAPPNALAFPFGWRPLLAGWKLLFLREGAYRPDPARSPEWNRGAYLAEGLGHCGACHTPRNRFGAEVAEARFGGGEAEGWNAYAIDAASPAPIPWTPDALAFYLRHGYHEAHGVARGPMAEVTGNLRGLPDEDVRAIAAYVADLMGQPSAERAGAARDLGRYVAHAPGAAAPVADSQTRRAPEASGRGGEIYTAACAPCHEAGRPQPFGGLDFHLSTAVNAPNPQNIVNVTLFGLPPGDGELSAVMPAFGPTLSDADMVALLAYLRRFGGKPDWQGLDRLVADTRSGAHRVTLRPADGLERAPENVGAAEGPPGK